MTTKRRIPFMAKQWLLAVLVLALLPFVAVAEDTSALNHQLIGAAKSGNLALVKKLLEDGADVNAINESHLTPLDVAESEDHKEIAFLLKAHGGYSSEGLRIAGFADRVARRGGELFLRLRDGRVLSERDTPSYPAAEACGYSDATGAANLHYSFTDVIDPWNVIHMQYYEGEGMKFINRVTGTVTSVRGAGEFSPDKSHFLARGYPGEFSCGTEIWKLSSNGPAREWALENCSGEYRWSDPSTVEVSYNGEVDARIKHDGSKWRCEGSPEICEDQVLAPSPESDSAQKSNESDITPLMKAAAAGDLERINALLDNGADVNAEIESQSTALEKAAEGGHLEAVKALVVRGANVNASVRWPALIWAASIRQWDIVKFLLDKGAEMHAEFGWSALMKAAEDDHREFVRALLDRGVPINPGEGPTALMYAAGRGRLEMVKLLLEKGADVSAKNEYGRTALMLAAIRNHAGVVGLLLDRGAAVDAQDEDGYTALMDAAWGGSPEEVRILLDKGAEIDARNRRGETALKLARLCDHKEIIELLKAHGAKD